MFFKHIYDKSLAQGSYLIGCQATGEAIVIDAQRDVDVYQQIAEENNLNITHITETHIHADYLCGSRELAAATGAEMYLSDEGGEGWQYEFPHKGLKDGDVIKVGNLTLEVMHTPGHTPESISFILRDHPATDEPVMAFTGDFVFVGDVGRPDLLEEAAGIVGTKEAGAKDMYKSIQRFSKLPDHIQIWPAHGAGSACGKALGAVPSSTLGYEKIRNWAFQYENDEEGFIKYLLEGQPEPPYYFAMMKHLNKVNRPLLVEVPQHPHLIQQQFDRGRANGLKVIDAREKEDFAEGYMSGSINITGNNSFSTWCGWILNYREQFILVCETSQIEDLTRKLMRIGLDNMYGYVTPEDLNDWGLLTEKVDLVDKEEVESKMGNGRVQILDVRGQTEFDENHIPGSDHAFVGTLLSHLDKVDKNKEVIVHCHSGARASVAHSLLKKEGFDNLHLYLGGMCEWLGNGNDVECKA